MIRTFGISLAVVTMLALSYIVSRPSRFRVEKKTDITAASGRVSDFVGSLSTWPQWLPALSPATNVRLTIYGDTGNFSGNAEAGEGTVKITEKSAAALTATVNFERPRASTQTLHFEFAASDSGTELNASVEGDLNFTEKFFSASGIDATRATATELENALNALKTTLERPAP